MALSLALAPAVRDVVHVFCLCLGLFLCVYLWLQRWLCLLLARVSFVNTVMKFKQSVQERSSMGELCFLIVIIVLHIFFTENNCDFSWRVHGCIKVSHKSPGFCLVTHVVKVIVPPICLIFGCYLWIIKYDEESVLHEWTSIRACEVCLCCFQQKSESKKIATLLTF